MEERFAFGSASKRLPLRVEIVNQRIYNNQQKTKEKQNCITSFDSKHKTLNIKNIKNGYRILFIFQILEN